MASVKVLSCSWRSMGRGGAVLFLFAGGCRAVAERMWNVCPLRSPLLHQPRVIIIGRKGWS